MNIQDALDTVYSMKFAGLFGERLRVATELGLGGELRLMWQLDAPDATGQVDGPIVLHHLSVLSRATIESIIDPAVFERLLFSQFLKLLHHEAGEAFLLGNRRPFDPHREAVQS